MYQSLAVKIADRQGRAATQLVILGVVLIVVPSSVLVSSMGDSVHRFVHKACPDWVSELRVDVGPGYRVYYARAGNAIVVLL